MEKHIVDPNTLLKLITSSSGNSGAFTIQSKRTQVDYTYQISRKLHAGNMYTFVKVEQGYQNFRFLGFYWNGSIQLKKQPVNTPAAVAIQWVLNKLEAGVNLTDAISVYHLGRCLKCGKVLTDATSISIGLGPYCRKL